MSTAALRQVANVLDYPWLWRGFRRVVDLAWGHYRKRFRLLEGWGVTGEGLSVLDVGCGSGEYAAVFRGPYTGIDLSPRYVAAASRRHGGADRSFLCADVATLADERRTYDVVVLVDFLHHFPDRTATEILAGVARLARGHVVSLEPISDQTNPVGRALVGMDRGRHMRPRDAVVELFAAAGLSPARQSELYLGPIRTWAWLCPGLAG
jgi:SAM-dependent methyltransferase